VVGVDGSENMLTQAHAKLTTTRTKLKLSFREEDIRSVKLPGQFDAALMMFAVLGYQLENRDVLATLTSARQNFARRSAPDFRCLVWPGCAPCTPIGTRRSYCGFGRYNSSRCLGQTRCLPPSVFSSD